MQNKVFSVQFQALNRVQRGLSVICDGKISLPHSDLQMESGSCCEAQCPNRAEVPGLPFLRVDPTTRVPWW